MIFLRLIFNVAFNVLIILLIRFEFDFNSTKNRHDWSELEQSRASTRGGERGSISQHREIQVKRPLLGCTNSLGMQGVGNVTPACLPWTAPTCYGELNDSTATVARRVDMTKDRFLVLRHRTYTPNISCTSSVRFIIIMSVPPLCADNSG